MNPTVEKLAIALSDPQRLSGDNLIMYLTAFERAKVDTPGWTLDLWKVLDTGNSRNWSEFYTDLLDDKDNFGKRVKEYEQQMKSVLEKVEPGDIEKMREYLQKVLIDKPEHEAKLKKLERLARFRRDMINSGIDPKLVRQEIERLAGKDLDSEMKEQLKIFTEPI